jgi:superoxide dismutase, Cu-Zn family
MRIFPYFMPLLLACGGGAKQTAETLEGAVRDRPAAGAALEPRSGSTTTGFVEARAMDGGTHLTIRVANATPGKHGVHLHETGDCSAPDASSAGAHWAPAGHPHGAPGAGSHGGDLGNIEVGEDGTGALSIHVMHPLDEVKGKALVVHAKEDDLTTQPAGDSGDRIACGVIVDAP